MTERRLDHLDPATIAALVDRTLSAEERASAEAHLAVCADCREVWVETNEIAEETRGIETTGPDMKVVVARTLSRRWIYAGAAIAASLLLAMFSPRLFDGDGSDRRALIEAVGQNRRTEARLTGGFAWGQKPVATRSATADPVPPQLEMAAARIEERAAGRNDAEAFAAAGAARLLLGRAEEAIAALEESVRIDSTSARSWSDLSAAYLELHRVRNASASAGRARECAERALTLDERSVEARFNHALALERLNLRDEAVAAWRAYLDLESTPAWRAEAESHISALTRTP